jgi:hypothetical protein
LEEKEAEDDDKESDYSSDESEGNASAEEWEV